MKKRFEPASVFKKLNDTKIRTSADRRAARLRRPETMAKAFIAGALNGDVNCAEMILRLYKHYQVWGEFELDVIHEYETAPDRNKSKAVIP